jgi:hypothetical protein
MFIARSFACRAQANFFAHDITDIFGGFILDANF